MTLQDEETPIDQEIVNELVGLVPEAWNRVVLEVKYSVDERGEGFEHSISNPDGHRDLVEPSDAIYAATWELQELFRKYGGSWTRVTYRVSIEDDGIEYRVNFDRERDTQ